MDNLSKLDSLILSYFHTKRELEDLDKIVKNENVQIKKIMGDLVLSHYEVDGYVATRTVSERSKMDEDILLSIIQSSDELLDIAKNSDIIKTKEYIDFDALENAMYKGLFSNDQLLELNKAVNVKEVVTLKVTKRKTTERK